MKLLLRLATVIVLAVLWYDGFAQTRAIDSLRTVLEKEQAGIRRVDALNAMAYAYYDINDSIGSVYATMAYQEAVRINYQPGIKYSRVLKGVGLMSKGEFEGALQILREALAIPLTRENMHAEIYALTLTANIYRTLSIYDSAQLLYDEALSMAVTSNDSLSLANVYKNVGMMKLMQWKNEEAFTCAKNANRYLIRGRDDYLEAEVLNLLGRAYLNLQKPDSAAIQFERMCRIIPAEDYYHQIKCALQWAEFYNDDGNYTEALNRCFEALHYAESYEYPPQMVEIYLMLGETYSELSQFELAARYLFEALTIADRYKLRYQYGTVCSTLAWVNKSLSNFDLALDFLKRSQIARASINDEHGVSNCHNIRGLIYLQQGKYDLAIRELETSRKIREAINHPEGVSACIFNLSLVYEAQGDLAKAYQFQLEALKIDEQIGSKQSLGISYNSLAELMIKFNRYDDARNYLERGRKLSDETRSRLLRLVNYRLWAEYYSGRKDYKRAFEYQRLYQQLNDSIYQASSRTKLAEMESVYQIEQRDQKIRLLSQEKKLAEKENSLQRSQINFQKLIIGSGIIGFLLVSLLTWNFYQSKRKIQHASREILEQKEEIQAQSEELVEANQTIAQINRDLEEKVESRTSELKQAYKELDTFFYRSSHDFRRPLTTFLGLAEVAKVTVKDTNALELFEKVKETAHNLDKMLVKLQSISDVGGQEMVYREVFLKEIVDSFRDQYRDQLEARGMELLFTSSLSVPFYSYPALVKIIVDNLLENSLHFATLENPYVRVRVMQQGDVLQLDVVDNGQGIDDEYHDRIFDMYFRANHASKGNGLGLYIVKKAVEKLHGEITFTSVKNAGSAFTVILPLSLQ